jgi:hypothetical protein
MAETTATTTSRTRTRRNAAATDRSTAAKKAAATRARNRAAEATKRSAAAQKAAETRRELQRTPVERYVDFAGRAVTIPVGAALVARDNVAELAARLSSLDGVERELRDRRGRLETELARFERRGTTARDSVERELGRRRERVENLVQTSITAGTQAAAKAVERVARVA